MYDRKRPTDEVITETSGPYKRGQEGAMMLGNVLAFGLYAALGLYIGWLIFG